MTSSKSSANMTRKAAVEGMTGTEKRAEMIMGLQKAHRTMTESRFSELSAVENAVEGARLAFLHDMWLARQSRPEYLASWPPGELRGSWTTRSV